MTIFDCFLYNGEKELLDIRINELKNLPIKHVLVDSELTFTGLEKDKSLMFDPIQYPDIIVWENNLFPFSERGLTHFEPGNNAGTHKKWEGSPWDNERVLRNTFYSPLHYLHPQPSDIIILSDVDEIPCWGRVEEFNDDELCCLQMDEYHLFLNTRYREQSWRHPKIFKYQYMLDHPEMSFDMIRNAGGKIIEGGGWHFSSMGPAERILNKFKSFSHQEPEIQKAASIEHIQNCMNNLRHLHTDEPLTVIHDQGLGDIPTCIYHNHEKFKHLLYV